MLVLWKGIWLKLILINGLHKVFPFRHPVLLLLLEFFSLHFILCFESYIENHGIPLLNIPRLCIACMLLL